MPVDRIDEVSIHRLDRFDGLAVQEVFDGLSPDSRFARYHTGTPVLPSGSMSLLGRVDGGDVAALAARDRGGSAIGLVWLIRTAEHDGELAIEVVDSWHRRGVGTRLLGAAEEAARAIGIGRLRADLLATNRAAVRLIGNTAPHATITREGPELVFEWEPRRRRPLRGSARPPPARGPNIRSYQMLKTRAGDALLRRVPAGAVPSDRGVATLGSS